MSNVRLTWTPPAPPTARQRPQSHLRVDEKVDGAPDFAPITAELPLDQVELLIADVAPGTWHYRVVTVDDAGVESFAETAVDVAFDAPNAVTDLAAIIE